MELSERSRVFICIKHGIVLGYSDASILFFAKRLINNDKTPVVNNRFLGAGLIESPEDSQLPITDVVKAINDRKLCRTEMLFPEELSGRYLEAVYEDALHKVVRKEYMQVYFHNKIRSHESAEFLNKHAEDPYLNRRALSLWDLAL